MTISTTPLKHLCNGCCAHRNPSLPAPYLTGLQTASLRLQQVSVLPHGEKHHLSRLNMLNVEYKQASWAEIRVQGTCKGLILPARYLSILLS